MIAEKNFYTNGWRISYEKEGWDYDLVVYRNKINNDYTPMEDSEDGLTLIVDAYGGKKKMRRKGCFFLTFLRSIDEVY